MKRRMTVSVSPSHPMARTAVGFMVLSGVLRLVHFLPQTLPPLFSVSQVALPTLAVFCFLLGLHPRLGLRRSSLLAVVLGVVFFYFRIWSMALPLWHQVLCTALYTAVLLLYSLTVLGVLPTKKLLYPLFGLPLLYHIFVEDVPLYWCADPPVPVWDWMPELSVLCIMAALLCLSFALKTGRC